MHIIPRWMLFCCFFSMGVVFASPQKQKKMSSKAELFDQVYDCLARAKGKKLTLGCRLPSKISLSKAVGILAQKHELNRRHGESGSLLKIALANEGRALLVSFLLQNGTCPVVPVVANNKVVDEPLLINAFKRHVATTDLIKSLLAPQYRSLVFPGGVKEAIAQYSQVEPLAQCSTSAYGKYALLGKLISQWAESEGITFTLDLIKEDDLPFTEIKEQCEQCLLSGKNVGLSTVVSEGKTLQEVFEYLYKNGQLHLPNNSKKRDRKRPGFLRLALKNNEVKKEVVDYLLHHGAPVTFFNVRHGCMQNIFWQAYAGSSLRTIGDLFSPEQRAYVFNNDVTVARQLWNSYKLLAKCYTMQCKISFIEGLVCAWEAEVAEAAGNNYPELVEVTEQDVVMQENSGALLSMQDDNQEMTVSESFQDMDIQEDDEEISLDAELPAISSSIQASSFDELVHFLIQRSSYDTRLSDCFDSGVCLADAIRKVGEQGEINRIWDKDKTLLKIALHTSFNPALIGILLQSGAFAKIFVSSADSVKEVSLFEYTLTTFDLNSSDLVAIYLSPSMRSFVFPGGVSEALAVLKKAQAIFAQQNKSSEALVLAEELIVDWAKSKAIICDKPICQSNQTIAPMSEDYDDSDSAVSDNGDSDEDSDDLNEAFETALTCVIGDVNDYYITQAEQEANDWLGKW